MSYLKKAKKETRVKLTARAAANAATIRGLSAFKLLRVVAERWFGQPLPMDLVNLVFQEMSQAQQTKESMTGDEAEALIDQAIADYRADMVAQSMAAAGSMFETPNTPAAPVEKEDVEA
jgi:hypothetical protein